VCVQPGSTTEWNLTDYSRIHNMRFSSLVIGNLEELRTAFINGRCDALATDASSLASFREAHGRNAGLSRVLPGSISKEPPGSVVRWAHFARLTAEELEITSKSIDTFRSSSNPELQRFMGAAGDLGAAPGLQPDRAVKIVKQVANFAEMWDRNITPLGVQRGMNDLWTNGGFRYAPPMR
jgi:general L-amino acid transport system substrate-binding protein